MKKKVELASLLGWLGVNSKGVKLTRSRVYSRVGTCGRAFREQASDRLLPDIPVHARPQYDMRSSMLARVSLGDERAGHLPRAKRDETRGGLGKFPIMGLP